MAKKPKKYSYSELETRFANDPLIFIKMCWPEMKLADYQSRIVQSLLDSTETFVHAANGVGKTRIAALIALWFYMTRTPARVIVTSSSEDQLKKILWKEIRMLVSISKVPFPIEVLQLEILKKPEPGLKFDDRDGLFGMVTRSVESFQGFHLPKDRNRVLLVIDEASGVDDEFYEAGQTWADRILAIGNPMKINGFFFRQCKAGNRQDPINPKKNLRTVIHVSAKDSHNVQYGISLAKEGRLTEYKDIIDGIIGYFKYRRLEQELEGPMRTIRLLGQFYEGEHARLFPDAWLDLAMDRNLWAELNVTDRRPLAMGIDVAAGGRDKTCWTLIDEKGIIEQIVKDIEDSMKIVGYTIELINQFCLSSAAVVIDAGGGGKQVADRLLEKGKSMTVLNFGESPDAANAYVNRRGELFGRLREKMKPENGKKPFALPPDAHELRTELAILPLDYDSEGRLVLLRKRSTKPGEDSIQKRLRRSPDRADSLALAVWGLNIVPHRLFRSRPIMSRHRKTSVPGAPKLTREEIMNFPDGYREKMSILMDILHPGIWNEENE